ncbi:uncharacterized protein EI90DRAFT_3289180 [Cantharellus anzutake]|uniref:uncharacterized protein n=1 Tax=Cantharellus anzutake TaxID=1750568 RepID=UPI0019030C45|nr:uncharacterized protein EI90DRAFT_3289180 [Cantharellus anzutake]KAF8331936.1 hypothetical protein EI90DRAFT_3289180 [Cantharellus anzutake]
MKTVHPTVDSKQVWVDLCREDATAVQYCKTFLQICVESSVHERVLLDDADGREEVKEQSIKSCRSLNTFWTKDTHSTTAAVTSQRHTDATSSST